MTDDSHLTEWDLALRKLGIKNAQADKLGSQSTKEVYISSSVIKDDSEEQVEDKDDELELIRRNRIKELSEYSKMAKFGSVYEITASDYVQEVNEAGKDVWVMLHLYQNNITTCKYINNAMDILAPLYPMVKFIRSVATKCIKDYPDVNVPTIFLHRNGDLLQKYIGKSSFNAFNNPFTPRDLERIMKINKVIDTPLQDDIDDSYEESHKKTNITSSIFGKIRSDYDD